MNIKIILTLCGLFLFLSACSSSKSSASDPNAPTTEWDHEQIRKARQATQEEALRNPLPTAPSTTLNCQILSDSQRKRARATGCYKLDAQLGYGENMYCCDR
jgi:PBP1b-binding outer membrane lipoprotein LpoB